MMKAIFAICTAALTVVATQAVAQQNRLALPSR
jgi:hypothetical protein